MSEEGKQAALAIAEQMRLKDERIAELEVALRDVLDADEPDLVWLTQAHANKVLAKAGPR